MISPRCTLRQLEIFAAVMQTGQVRGAAETLHLSQAAVSQSLAELADALQVSLFTRCGRALVPTPTARRLLALTRGPRAELASLPQRLRGENDSDLAGPIHIAASSTIARYVLPAPLAGLIKTHPALRATLSSGNSATVENRVAAGEADLGFIEGPAIRDDIETRRWRTDHLEVIGPRDAATDLRADEVGEWGWVVREPGSGTRTVFEHSLALAGIPVPLATLVVDDSGAQVRAVAAGAGLACVSRAAAAAAARAGEIQFMSLAGHVFARPLWAIRRTGEPDTPLIARVLTALTPA